IDEVTAKGVFVTGSAGNAGRKGWQDQWRPINATVGGQAGTYMDFGGGQFLQPFTLAQNDFFSPFVFQWDNAWLEGGPGANNNFQVPNNLDIFITSQDGSQILASGTDDNTNTDAALEFLSGFQNTSNTATQFAIAIRLVSGPAPNLLRWFTRNGA